MIFLKKITLFLLTVTVVYITTTVSAFAMPLNESFPYGKTNISQQVITLSNNQVKEHIILQKRVCRYIDGQKRCWDE